MKILVTLAHPNPASFNAAIAHTVVETLEAGGHEVIFHDLYQEKFDPVLPVGEVAKDAPLPDLIARHSAEVAAADGIIIIHPSWWGQPPAILKGWLDRVFTWTWPTVSPAKSAPAFPKGCFEPKLPWFLPRPIPRRSGKLISTAIP